MRTVLEYEGERLELLTPAEQDAVCDELADGKDACEDCGETIPKGAHVFWFSDGGWEPRDGTYVCRKCSAKYINNGGITP